MIPTIIFWNDSNFKLNVKVFDLTANPEKSLRRIYNKSLTMGLRGLLADEIHRNFKYV